VRLRTDTPAVSNLPWPQIGGSIAVLLLVLGVLWWKPWHQRGAARGPAAPVTAAPAAAASGAAVKDAATEATGPETGPVNAATLPSTSAGAAVPAGAQAAPADGDATAGAGRARLRLSFSADSWVDIRDALGRRTFAGKGRANTVRTVAGPAPLRVYLGFASGVQLEVNNRAVAIGRQFLAGDVARFEAGADGVLRRDSHSAAPTGAAAPGAASAAAAPAAAAPAGAPSRNARPTG
jgi:hypothetical protein